MNAYNYVTLEELLSQIKSNLIKLLATHTLTVEF